MSENKQDIIQYYTKLSEIRDGIERIPKNGYNSFHKYKYTKEEDVLEYLRKELSNNKMFISTSLENQNVFNYEMDDGKKYNLLTTVIMVFEITDIETGFSKSYRFAGYGSDKQDKGGYKAYTGGIKYFLMKMFQISTGDDPENDIGNGTNGKPAPKIKPVDDWVKRLEEFEKTLPEHARAHMKPLSAKERAEYYKKYNKDIDKIVDAVDGEIADKDVPAIDGILNPEGE